MSQTIPSARVQALLRSVSAIRQKSCMVGDQELELLLMDQNLDPSPALLAFERRYGGWVGAWMTLGLAAMQQLRSRARLPGHALIGRRGPDAVFMTPAGHVVVVEAGRPRLEAARIDAWLEREALWLPISKKPNALVARLWGAHVETMVAAEQAVRDESASDEVSTTWVLPQGRGLLVAHESEVVATFASVRAASRCLDDPAVGVIFRPLRPDVRRAFGNDAPRPDTEEVTLSFRPRTCAGLTRQAAKATMGEDPVLHQWSFADEPQNVRSHALLRDGGSRLTLYLTAEALPPLEAVEATRDPLLTTRTRDAFDALLFARGFSSSDAAWRFERAHGGASFWAGARPVQLGAVALLRTDPGWTADELRAAQMTDHIPIAHAFERDWAMAPHGAIALIRDDGAPEPYRGASRFPDAGAFLRHLAAHATPWRGFPYSVEALPMPPRAPNRLNRWILGGLGEQALRRFEVLDRRRTTQIEQILSRSDVARLRTLARGDVGKRVFDWHALPQHRSARARPLPGA